MRLEEREEREPCAWRGSHVLEREERREVQAERVFFRLRELGGMSDPETLMQCICTSPIERKRAARWASTLLTEAGFTVVCLQK
jgi:hypothetical protein